MSTVIVNVLFMAPSLPENLVNKQVLETTPLMFNVRIESPMSISGNENCKRHVYSLME